MPHLPTRDSERLVCLVINTTAWKNLESLGSLGNRHYLKRLDTLEDHRTYSRIGTKRNRKVALKERSGYRDAFKDSKDI